MSNVIKTDVLIVGAGPVGMVLANILKRNKIDVCIIDKNKKRSESTKAVSISPASIDIFNILKISNISLLANQVEKINLFHGKKKLGELNFDLKLTCNPYFYHFAQIRVENELENSLKKLKLNVNRECELLSYSQTHNAIYSHVKSNNGEIIIQSEFLIGCDGGHSYVRQLSGFGVDERRYGPSFILADVTLDGYQDINTKYIFTKNGYAMLVPLTKNNYRLIFSVKDNNSNSISKAVLQRLLDERVREKIEILNVNWSACAPYGHRISNTAFEGKVVLAGDALHQFSPIGGTNMNVGIQDAFSLGWRIIHEIMKLSKSLDVYAKERMEIINDQRELTEYLTSLLTRSKNYTQTILPEKVGNLRSKLSGYQKYHLQNYITYSPLNKGTRKIQKAIANASYILFTQGKINRSLRERITSYLKKNKKISWVSQITNSPFKFYFCRPDAIVIHTGSYESLQQLIINSNRSTL